MGTIRYEVGDGVATITIDRPEKLNAMTVAMDEEFNAACRDATLDDAVRAVVLAGARGDHGKAFCAGSDIGDLDQYGTNWQYRNRMDAGKDYVYGLWHVAQAGRRRPVRLLHRRRARTGVRSDVRVAEALHPLRRRRDPLGLARRIWGDAVPHPCDRPRPRRAHAADRRADRRRRGPPHRPHPGPRRPGAGVDVAHDLAARIAAMAPIAAQSTKNLIRVATSTSVEVGMRYENDMFAYCMMTDDAAEGRRAFAGEAPARVHRGVSGGDRRGHPPHRHPTRGSHQRRLPVGR